MRVCTDTLVGPSMFGFSMEDPGAAARLFKDFAKTNDAVRGKGTVRQWTADGC